MEPNEDELAQIREQKEPTPSVTVSIVDGQVQVSTDNLSILAAPTLLRLAANTVETEVGL